MYYYTQLAGSLGMLKSNGVNLPWSEINEKLLQIAADNGMECDTDEVRQMHQKYREMCVKLGLINIGELFNDRDCIPLI